MFGKKKKPLFGSSIAPDCKYCAHFSGDGAGDSCELGHSPGPCADFAYDPLLRAPSRLPSLKKHDPDEFKL